MTGLVEALTGPVLEVAPRLLAAVLRHETEDGTVAVRLTEVEAYAGEHDPGSHAYRGPTRRNQVMFGPAGHLYVYFTYGMHHCCNVVVGEDGHASAVLLRAGEVVDGLDLARTRRRTGPDRDLARGPARLCQALAVDLDDNGTYLGQGHLTLTLPEQPLDPGRLRTGPRVGLRHAAEHPWRFWIADEPTVSVYRPAKRLAEPRSRRRGAV